MTAGGGEPRSAKIRIGMIGVGAGGAAVLPAMTETDGYELIAAADVSPVTLERFQATYPQARTYTSAEALCADPGVDAVWVASPNRFHAEHAVLSARAGKHVVVEKPMALTLEQAELMISTAAENGVQLLCGHTMADPVSIRAMRKIIDSGQIGAVRNIQMFSYTDWLIRPRTADELNVSQGGGLPFRQAPRQIDTIRVIGNRRLRSVRGMAGRWMPERAIAGFYTAYFEFEDDTPAEILHDGHGYLMTGEYIEWQRQHDLASLQRRVETRRAMRAGTRDEDADKQELRIGGQQQTTDARREWVPQDPGILIVSCERGVLRHSRFGVNVYDDDGLHEVDLVRPSQGIGYQELEELYRGVIHGEPLFHDGIWGLGTLEACLAIMQSGEEHREIVLSHQGELSKYSDDDIVVSYLGDKAV